eukprot:8661270-Pyramimonas_sp.AAC.1
MRSSGGSEGSRGCPGGVPKARHASSDAHSVLCARHCMHIAFIFLRSLVLRRGRALVCAFGSAIGGQG